VLVDKLGNNSPSQLELNQYEPLPHKTERQRKLSSARMFKQVVERGISSY